jgi:hypothetical protein
MDPNALHRDVIAKIRILADSNMGAASVIVNSGKDIPTVISQLEKYSVRGEKIWCIFNHMCAGDQISTTEFIINMDEPLTGYCSAEHDWGPSRSAKRTQCFAPECKMEATKYCSRCYSARYCSRQCQSIGWKNGHNKRCQKNITNINNAVEEMGVTESSRRLYSLGLLSEQGVVHYMRKHHDA